MPALATGSVAISPLDMATGYQTIANDGRHCEPYTVQSIERDGKVLLEHERACDPVLKQGDARLITSMLEAVPVSGTAASAFGGWGSWPVAGKTGTAQENTNVWFGGYTKQYTTVVWVGSPGNPYPMGHVFGGTVAAPIWVSYMTRVMQGLPAIGFPTRRSPRGPGAERDRHEAGRGDHDALGGGLPVLRRGRGLAEPEGRGLQPVPRRWLDHCARHARAAPDLHGVPGQVTMPKVVGMRGYEARAFLESLGLVVEIVRIETGDPAKVGYVIAQDPRSQTVVVQGSAATIFVGELKDKGTGTGTGTAVVEVTGRG